MRCAIFYEWIFFPLSHNGIWRKFLICDVHFFTNISSPHFHLTVSEGNYVLLQLHEVIIRTQFHYYKQSSQRFAWTHGLPSLDKRLKQGWNCIYYGITVPLAFAVKKKDSQKILKLLRKTFLGASSWYLLNILGWSEKINC